MRYCAVAIAVLFLSLRVSAHHAFAAEYNANKLVIVSGVVTKFEWTNPHAWVYVEGKDETGAAAMWAFEMGSPSGLLHRGWTKIALQEGDRITVDGYCAKDGRKVANARNITMP